MNKRFNKKIQILFSVLTVCALCFTLFAGLTANAAYSGGSGTKKDPYLLKTADDVQNIEKNLNAHYKLAATIDLSAKSEFKPIGCLGKPFKGSLSCDLGTDGLPRYALLNLKVYNHAGETGNHKFAEAGPGFYADYDKNGFSYYESGLFGTIEGAAIKNILILKANIKSTVVGQHQGRWYGNELRSCAEQVDNQGTAILAGIAKNSTITGCGVQGVITSDSNHTAGLVGRSLGSSISYCWADINSKTRGFWFSAGLVGSAGSSTSISYSYAKGEIYCTSGKVYGLGNGACGAGLAGSVTVDSMVSDCYSEVNFASGSVITGVFTASKLDGGKGTVSNCYATGVIKGATAPTGAASNDSNCWILNTGGQYQQDFKLGSAAEIKAAFSGKKGWNTDGNLPTLSGVKYITDYSIYIAGKERAGAGTAAVQTPVASDNGSGTANVNSAVPDSSNAGDPTDITASGDNIGDGQQGDTQTVVQSGYRNSATYTVLFVCLTAVVICITAFSFCLLLKSMEKVKAAKAANPETALTEIFSSSGAPDDTQE